jgi:hypothetical protein
MAAPRPPQISDARVPCPLCGGLVHPVAGRCKHCKQDLTALRSGRPHAAAQLPALVGASRGNGHAAATPVPIAAREESQPILPPRPADQPAAATEAGPPAWRRWPMLVMALAVVAIVIAVIVLLWGPKTPAQAGQLPPGPAPERMDTDPLQHSAQPPAPQAPPSDDPWQSGPPQPHAQAPARKMPDPVPDDSDDTDSLDLGGAGGNGGLAGSLGAADTRLSTMALVGQHLCDRLKQCGTADADMAAYCTKIAEIQRQFPAGAQCDARTRCLEHVDHLPCTTKADDDGAVFRLMTQLSDCMEALQRC